MDDSPSLRREHAVRTLLLWSGGIDSTYTLWRLIALNAHVITLHVSIHGDDEMAATRSCYERSAAHAIARWLRAEAGRRGDALLHLESSATHPGAPHRDGRASVLLFHAARAMAALAFTPRDRLSLGVNAEVEAHWHPKSAGFALRRLLMLRQLRAGMERDDVPRLWLWEPRPAKASMLASMPDALAHLTVSCEQPVTSSDGTPHACERCTKCRWRERHQRDSAAAATSEHDVERAGAAIASRR